MLPLLPFNAGDVLYKYELRGRLGGGVGVFGDVWLAHDHSISSDVAVKMLDSGFSIDERLREARIGNKLNHQNLVKVHYADVVKHNGTDLVIIAMHFHKNGSIMNLVNADNFIPLPTVIRFMVDILRGLEYLHELSLYHNDIKPQNILIGDSSEGILTDYGISCFSPNGQPVQPAATYKLHKAPEVLNNNQVDIRTDIYQCGLTAFRLLNGIGLVRDRFNRLGESDYYELVRKGNIVQSGDYRHYIPSTLKRVINRAISVNPQDRYQSAVDMRRALERLSYPGYWTCDPQGTFVGINQSNEYRFEVQPRSVKLFDFIAFCKNTKSNREIQMSKYSSNKLSKTDLVKAKKAFMQWVVTGQ